MKTKNILALIAGIAGVLTGLTVWQWAGGNIAVQIGGSQNKIEQKAEPHFSSKSGK